MYIDKLLYNSIRKGENEQIFALTFLNFLSELVRILRIEPKVSFTHNVSYQQKWKKV